MLVQFTIPIGTATLDAIVDVCAGRCVDRWGGCTKTLGYGYWQHPDDGRVLDEPVAILSVECGAGDVNKATDTWKRVTQEWFDNLATYVRIKGDQHTVYYRLGDQARFVGPETIIYPGTGG